MSQDDDAYVTICIPATVNFMKVVREAIQQAAEDFGFSENDGAQIVMAVDEVRMWYSTERAMSPSNAPNCNCGWSLAKIGSS